MFDWTGIYWQIDVHVMDSDTASLLRQLRDSGWLALAISATTLAEIEGTPDRDKHQTLLDIATAFPIAQGAFTLGHSVLGMDFLSSEEDDARLHQVFSTLWPDRDFDADARGDTRNGTTCFRDAKQVSDAIRNSFHTFVTCDRQLLRGDADDLGVRMICTRTATQESLEAIERALRLRDLGSPYFLQGDPPGWPSMNECRAMLSAPLPTCSPSGCR